MTISDSEKKELKNISARVYKRAFDMLKHERLKHLKSSKRIPEHFTNFANITFEYVGL